MFRGEYLAGYGGEVVSLRFDPNDITTVWVYRQEDGREAFLTRAYAQGLETEQLSYEEAKVSSKRLRAAGKTLSNDSILQEALERDALVKKKSRKERQKEEQKLAKPQSQPALETESAEVEETIEDIGVELTPDLAAFEPIDFDELHGVW